VEREHESRHDPHQGVSVVRVLCKPFHESTLRSRNLEHYGDLLSICSFLS
jgi:hypothetical protein